MAYPLKKLFHMDRAKYEEEYLKRFNSPDAVHFDFKISGEQAFMCQTPEILNTIISIERTDKHVRSLHKDIPLAAINQFANRCLIDEIVLSNNIEGVHSTRRELSAILSDLSKQAPALLWIGEQVQSADDDRQYSVGKMRGCQKNI